MYTLVRSLSDIGLSQEFNEVEPGFLKNYYYFKNEEFREYFRITQACPPKYGHFKYHIFNGDCLL